MDGALIATFGLGGALGAVTVYAALVGGIGVVIGGRFERCAHCGHHGITDRGPIHASGCPGHPCTDRMARWWRVGRGGLHLHHHH